jgi:hypothetical protein
MTAGEVIHGTSVLQQVYTRVCYTTLGTELYSSCLLVLDAKHVCMYIDHLSVHDVGMLIGGLRDKSLVGSKSDLDTLSA